MKKILFIAVLMLGIGTEAQEQEYNTWAWGVDIGAHSLIDASNSAEPFIHMGVNVRKNLNRTFGVGLRGGYDKIELSTPPAGVIDDMYYATINLEAVVDVLSLAGLDTNWFTILAHGGPGISWTNYRTAAQLGGGFTGLIKLGSKGAAAFKMTYTMNANFNEPRTFDNKLASTNNGVSSVVNKFGIGFDFYIGDRNRGHADWTPDDNVYIKMYRSDTTIVNNYKTVNAAPAIITKKTVAPQEFVFFDHDKDRVKRSELNAIYQVHKYLVANPKSSVKIIGWASHTKSSGAYNLKLSERRCNKVKAKLIALGIAKNRLLIDAQGKDYDFDIENNHDVARRVELLIVK